MGSLRAYVKRNRLLRAALFTVQNAYYASPVAGHIKCDDVSGPSDTHFLAAMIRVKDEARFLPEWLAHHLNLGIEHVYVYDNNSTDAIDRVIAPFVERGLVTYIPWPTIPASPSSNIDFLTRFGRANEWVAFFDADEFLVEASPGALLETLRSAGRWPAVGVNWRYYGSSGHEVVPTGLITEAFDRADAEPCYHVKVLARPAMVRAYRNSHNLYYRRGGLARTAGGRRVYGSFVTPDRKPRLVLNHYIYRSREGYNQKASQGFVDARGSADQARRASLSDAEFHRHNDIHVPVPTAVLAATASLLDEFGYPEEIVTRQPNESGRRLPAVGRTHGAP